MQGLAPMGRGDKVSDCISEFRSQAGNGEAH